MSLIHRLIKTFMHNPMPDNVQNIFTQWLLSPDDAEEKNAALEQEWNAMCDSSVEDSVSSVTRWARLKRIHMRMNPEKGRRKGVFVPWYAVAVCLAGFLLVSALSFLSDRDVPVEPLTCFVTSTGKGEFSLPDGSSVWLNSDSRLEYRGDLSGKERRVVLYGEAFFDVNPSDAFFVVDMGDVSVKVLGTEFNARNTEAYGDYEVTLKSGKVIVESERFKDVTLAPGQQFVAPRLLDKAMVRSVDAADYTSWMGRSLSFDNTSLATVVTNLEHWFNANIDIDADVNKNTRISLTVRHESLCKTLDLISTLTGYKYEFAGKDSVTLTK